MSVKITRRDFLKGTAAGAMGLAVTGLIGKNAPAYAEAITNITYVSDPGTIPGPDDPEEPDSPDKNGGIDGLDLIDDTWN